MMTKPEIKGTGRYIGRYGFGCAATGGHGWGEDTGMQAIEAVRVAYDYGIDFFDNADVYGLGISEERLCKALGANRHKVVIATKGGLIWNRAKGKSERNCARDHLISAVEASLRRLKLDSIPLYYVHWPDEATSIEEIMSTLIRLRESGKIQAIGLSNFSSEDVLLACRIGSVAAVQVRLNLLMLDNAEHYLGLCRDHGMVLVAWGGLCDGLLTGKYTRDTRFPANDHRSRAPHFQGNKFIQNLEIVQQLSKISSMLGISLSSLALRSLASMYEQVCVLFGAKTPEQAEENCSDLNMSLAEDALEKIQAIIKKKNSFN